jgi:hypothetical protein
VREKLFITLVERKVDQRLQIDQHDQAQKTEPTNEDCEIIGQSWRYIRDQVRDHVG